MIKKHEISLNILTFVPQPHPEEAKILSRTHLVASKHIYIKKEKGSLPVDVRRSKTSLLKLSSILK